MPSVLVSAAAEVEVVLARELARARLPDNLREAVAYAVLAPGKRLRPGLVQLSARAIGGDGVTALPAAAAMELIHCFSLVHDDLPAMDDDDLRRGRPTLHIHAGEAMAILAGDAMVSLAFSMLSRSGHGDGGVRAELVGELAEATTAMIGGQVYDTLGGFAPELSDEERLRLVHAHKTGALLRASCRMGGIAGGAGGDELAALTTYGESIGLMYQIVDDLLDVTQSTEHLGKATGKDESAGKLTYPGRLGVEASRQEVQRLHARAVEAIAPLGAPAIPLREVSDYLAVRTR